MPLEFPPDANLAHLQSFAVLCNHLVLIHLVPMSFCMFLSRSIWQSHSWNCSAVKAVPNFTSPALFREVLFPTLWLTVLNMYFTLSLQAYLCNKPSTARFRAFEMCGARLSPFPWLILLIPNPWLSSCRFQLKHYCLLEDLEDCSHPRGRSAQCLLCSLSPPHLHPPPQSSFLP